MISMFSMPSVASLRALVMKDLVLVSGFDPTQQTMDGADLHHGFAALGGPLIVPAQPPPAPHTTKALLYHPADLQGLETGLVRRLAADLQSQTTLRQVGREGRVVVLAVCEHRP